MIFDGFHNAVSSFMGEGVIIHTAMRSIMVDAIYIYIYNTTNIYVVVHIN